VQIGDILQTYLDKAIDFLPRLIAALVVFGLSLLGASLVAQWVRKTLKSQFEDKELASLLARITRWTLVIVGTIVALDQVNFDVTGFLAGLGIAGITIGFALQDVARNFVAGILMLIRRPFEVGHRVEIADFEGTVQEITTRDTVIRTMDGEMVIIPNIEVYQNPILNYSGYPEHRRSVRIGLGYDEDVSGAVELFLETIQQVEGVLKDPAPSIYAEELGDSALILLARFWLDQRESGFYGVQSNVVQAIKETAEREGIDLPYPTQVVRVEGEAISS